MSHFHIHRRCRWTPFLFKNVYNQICCTGEKFQQSFTKHTRVIKKIPSVERKNVHAPNPSKIE